MAHQSLYRKYRPQTFEDVVGQQHIETTLKNAVAEGKVAHAYLFTGPRGTGKTTTARLLAKALLCEHAVAGEPDGTCEQCIDVAEGRHPDVLEIDAASNTGVDNVREEIIGRVQYAPTRGSYKLYIIDEVHMLSTSAFNALLKTLEEPPARVVFVLATTHPHKVPDTILSRCQRFDFHRIGIEDLIGRLRTISDGEGFEVPDAALGLIARHASGGMRDAITTLEQLAAFTGGSITLADVEGLLGEVDVAQLIEISTLVARRDVAACFRWVARFAETGTDLAEFVRELTQHVRDLYLVSIVGDAEGVVDATPEELAKLISLAKEFGGPDRLARVLDLLGELSAELRWSSDPRLSLEVTLTRMARPAGEITLEALAERIEALESGVSAGTQRVSMFAEPAATVAAAAPVAPAESVAPAASVAAAAAPEPAQVAAPAAPAGRTRSSGVVATAAPAPDVEPELPPVDDARPAVSAAAPAQTPAEVAPAPAVITPATTGRAKLDRAAAKRAWPAVLLEIKKLKPARAHGYSQVEVDVDPDGETLVLEFPADQAFVKEMADQPDMKDMLKQAMMTVMGAVPSFRLQVGRGSVQPLRPPVAETALEPVVVPAPTPVRAAAASRHDDEPVPEYYETESGLDEREPVTSAGAAAVPVEKPATPAAATAPTAAAAPSTKAASGTSEIERLLMNDLGATIIKERTGPSEPGEIAAEEAETPELPVPTLDFGLADPDEDDD